MGRFTPHRLGLRARITLAFALGAFMLSVFLATTTYVLTRSTLVDQRDVSVRRQAFQNAQTMLDQLQTNPTKLDLKREVDLIQARGGGSPLLEYKGDWTSATSEFSPASVPTTLQKRVGDEQIPARMVISLKGRPVIAVGIPLTPYPAAYYELARLDEVADTLRSVAVSLVGASVITTSLGVLLGGWASRRSVRPLAEAALAAQAIAGGRLDTRLEPTDDSDLRSLTEAFNDMATALQTRVERDGRFASDVSHELRSPLMTLSASIEVMQARREEMPERARAALDLLSGDVTRFQGLVEDLLEISRFDAGAIRLHLEELLVAEFVRQAVSVSSLRDSPVHVTEPAENLMINGDKRRLARAIANLIDNARVYGGGAIDVYVYEVGDSPATAEAVRVAVEDHGPGVPVDERQLVFERFARGTGAGRRGLGDGSGLGLSLVDEHVRLHGGRVWITDRADGQSGARFVIELPAEMV